MADGPTGTQRIERLDALRAVAMFLVVGIHAHSYAGLDAEASDTWLRFAVSAAGVPIFFLVDGFLFASRRASERFDHARYLAASARRLLVPWLIFSAIYLVARAAAESWQLVHERVVLGKSPLGVAACAYFSCAALQMYFLLSLFAIRCLAPLWHRLARAPAWASLAAFAAATWLLRGLVLDAYEARFGARTDPLLLALWGLQFHLFGATLARHAAWLRRQRSPLLALAAVLVIAGRSGPISSPFVAQYAYLAALFLLFFGLEDVGRLLPRIGRETMGIYLLHTPVLMSAVTRLASPRVADPHALFAVVTVLSFAIALALALAIGRVPRGAILFGRLERRGAEGF